MKASELIGSRVLELNGATMCGTVCGIVPADNLKKILALEIFTENEDDCEKKFVETSKLTAVAEDVVTIKHTDLTVMQFPSETDSPVNRPAYSERGEYYGKITDVETDENFNVTALCVGARKFAPQEILTKSNELVVFRLPGSKTKLTKRVKRVPRPVDAKAKPLAVTPEPIEALPAPLPAQPSEGRVYVTDFKRYSFLLGKTLAEDVGDLTGAPVAVRGETVTQSLIDRAMSRGAIARLTMAAK